MKRSLARLGIVASLALAACGTATETPSTTPDAGPTLTATPAPTPIPTFAHQPLGLVATLQSDARFTTLVEVIEAAAFAETLDNEGAFTFLAPSNAAFEGLPAGSVEDLLKPENAQMAADLLRYHLIPQVLSAKELGELDSVDSALPGHRLLLRKRGDEILVNNIRILIGDIHATNGVIHMLEYVLQPSP